MAGWESCPPNAAIRVSLFNPLSASEAARREEFGGAIRADALLLVGTQQRELSLAPGETFVTSDGRYKFWH